MTTTRLVLAGLAGVAVLLPLGSCSAPPKKKPLTLAEMIAADPLPLARGSKWKYQVHVKRFDTEQNKVMLKIIEWTTEVVDAKEGNGVVAYRVRGWPSDLNEYDGTTPPPTPKETTILRRDNSFLFGSSPEPTLDGATGWFSWPVIDGQKICPGRIVYCWQVTAVETGYKLSFYTGPDEQSFELEPNTGVARFHFAHHPTTNEIDARLVEYTKGGAAQER